MHQVSRWTVCCYAILGCILLSTLGCGTTREHRATEQLVVSDAVDRSVQDLDFRPLSGRTDYLDTSYLRQVKDVGFVNAEYVISALRQQVLGAGCLLQDSSGEAEIIIEPRIGALGSDDHLVTYGIPENNSLNSAASLFAAGTAIPSIPEISVARREAREASAKIAAFAYDRETRKPIWQSGVRHSVATAKSTWVMGIGPFQGGSIRDKTKLAGSRFRFGKRSQSGSGANSFERPSVDYTAETRFNQGWPDFSDVGHGTQLMANDAGVPPGSTSEDPAMDSPVERVAEKPLPKPPSDPAAAARKSDKAKR